MKYIFAAIILTATALTALAQTNTFPSTGPAGIGTVKPNKSSLFEIKSTNRGLLIPRMTQNQRDSIKVPAKALLIYQTDNTPGFYYYNGTAWTAVTTLSANLQLSNLTGQTAINKDLLPNSTLKLDIGSPSVSWKGLYLSDGIYQFGQRILLSDTAHLNTWVGSQSGVLDKIGVRNTATGYSSLYFNSAGSNNTANGYDALYSNTNGNHNIAIGSASLFLNTTISDLVAIGDSALYNNGANNSSGAIANTAIGSKVLYNNISGAYNTGTGFNVLYFNTTGQANTANGYKALNNNINGFFNTAVGYLALTANTTGGQNTATGYDALFTNSIGYDNTANGTYALASNTTGSANTAVGVNSLVFNTTGSSNTANGNSALNHNTSGVGNTAVGIDAMQQNTEGNGNTAEGMRALLINTIGEYNTAIGTDALRVNTTGSFNTAVGFASLYGSTGSNNTALGYQAGCADGVSNSTALGYSAVATLSNQVIVGNSTIDVIGGQVNWSTFSDGRFKTNLKENVPGLSFINKLKPFTYNLELKKIDKFLGKNDKIINEKQLEYEAGEKKVHTGFIAQDVEKAALEIKYNFDGVHHPENDKDNYSLSYAEFVVPLVKAVQELSQQNDSLKVTTYSQQSQINDLQNQINQLKLMISSNQSTIISSASLQQNIPNPFRHTTNIGYSLNQKFTSAQIVITDKNGKTIKAINISSSGKGSVNVDASTLASGAYQYSLIIDGRLIETKQMVLAK